MFQLGYTFSFIKTMSIILNLLFFQISAAEFLPYAMGEYKNLKRYQRIIIVVIVWLLPLVIGSIPFLIYFHEDRSEWLQHHGFKQIDTNLSSQKVLNVFLYFDFAIYFFILSYVIWELKQIGWVHGKE